jgi:hypothetical protein
MKGGVVQAAVTCADTMGATNSPVEAEEFRIVTPCPALLNGVADCCFYTEENQKGEEMCLPSSSEPNQPSKEYKSYRCFPRQKPRVTGRNVPCPRPAEPEKFDTPVKQADISTEPCETAPRAQSADDEMLASFEQVVNDLGALAASDVVDNTYNGDLAATDNVDNTFVDYNTADFAATDFVDNTFTDYTGDLAATDNVDNTFIDYNTADFAATDFVDNTFTDYAGDLAATDYDNAFNVDYYGDFAATDFVDNTFNEYNGDFAATDFVDNTFNDYNGDFAATDYFDNTFNEYYGDFAEADVVEAFAMEFGDGSAASVGGADSTVQKAGAGQIVCTLMVLLVGLAFFL